MATQTATKPEQSTATDNWSSVFPTELATHKQSCLFVKKLLAVAVSNITYLRAIFPEHAYGYRSVDNLNLKILRDASNCPGACQVIKWMKGCFDALEKKYLKTLTIGIYTDPNQPDNVIESYIFKFSYLDNGEIDMHSNQQKISSSRNTADIKRATLSLLRSIVMVSGSLCPLPNNIIMTMKLLYYEDVTPEEYEPPGFKHCEADSFYFDQDPINVKVGDVNTNMHSVKVLVKTISPLLEADADQPEASQNTTQQTQVVEGVSERSTTPLQVVPGDMQVVPEPSLADSAPSTTPLQPAMTSDRAVSTTGSQDSTVNQVNTVNCTCGVHEDDGLMIMCAVCQCWQHAVCYLVLDDNDAPDSHICERCAQASNGEHEATDPTLCHLSDMAKEATCLWRRTLAACRESSMNKVLPVTLSRRLGVEVTVATGLINRMSKEGFFKPQTRGKRVGNYIDKVKLDEGVKKYLTKLPTLQNNRSTAPTEPPSQQPTAMDTLVSQAKELDIREPPTAQQKKQNDGPSTSGRGRKRTQSFKGKEFELGDSQDLSQPSPSRKRRRASVASKMIKARY